MKHDIIVSLINLHHNIWNKWTCLLWSMDGSYLPSESFSPESGGRVKPRTAMDAMRTHGTMRLKK